MKTIQTILNEFDEKFNRVWLHNGNLPIETYTSCEDDIKSFLRQALTHQRDEFEKMIVDEILICHQENTPTSRLTSLAMKVKDSMK